MIEVFNINETIIIGILNLNEFAINQNLTVKRDIESKGKQHLLNHLLQQEAEIFYDDKGKPHLVNDSRHISLSHSHDKLAIIINRNEATGIDIELIRDKVLRIKHKFLSEPELNDCALDVEKLLIYWAAKETLYKIYGLKEVDFIQNLKINSFSIQNSGKIFGAIALPNFTHNFHLNYRILENYVLVYSLNKM